ncbi:MAG: alanine racemase [Neisseriaceae bacterium]|nr:alanine racemase [Neisseriaceae bacterium]
MKPILNKPTLLAALLLATSLAPAWAQPQPPLNQIQQARVSNAWLEIDTQAFQRNLQTMKHMLNGQSKVCMVMKADAYGHGIANLLPTVLAENIPCIGVTSNREIQAVRDGGFNGQLVRLRSATAKEMTDALPYRVEEMLGNLDTARIANDIAKKNQQTIAYHLMLNSGGMDRNGLEVGHSQGKKDALAILKLSHLKPVGIMTHFAVEEVEEVREKAQLFAEQSQWLIQAGGLDRQHITLHAANSYTTLNVPEAWFDMVRPGALAYNYFDDGRYEHIFTLKTEIASVNPYLKGSSVGYDKAFTLKKDSRLANLPIGYSDGYLRSFTNTDAGQPNYVLIHGQKAPIVGKISMNTTMVDVSDIPNVKAGDEVVLFGQQGQARIDYESLSETNPAFVEKALWGNLLPKYNLPH